MSIMRVYHPFDMLFLYDSDGYRVEVLQSPSGQAEGHVEMLVNQEDLTDWQTGNLTGEQLERVGQHLFDGLFYGPVGNCMRSSLARISGDEGLRLNIRLHRTPELATLPWEILYDAESARFLALSERTSIVRYLALNLPEADALLVEPPLCILTVLASPSDSEPLNLEREWVALAKALGPLQEQQQVRLEKLTAPTLDALRRRLLEGDVHVLHFVGHGLFDEAEGDGYLLFENEDGGSHQVAARDLALLLHNHRALRLVYLNACEGAISGYDNAFAGVAQRLVQQGVPASLAMQREMSDTSAVTLAQAFYEALAAGYPVDAALTQARIALSLTDSHEWATPVFFSRSRDNMLLAAMESAKPPEFQRLPFEPETRYIPAGTFVMGRDSGVDVPTTETPAHTIFLGAFCMGKGVVTNREYAEYVSQDRSAEIPRRAGWFLRQPPADKLDQAVVGVSWQNALAYCHWLSAATGRTYRLPSEAEWEKTYLLVTLGGVEEWTSTRWGADPAQCEYGPWSSFRPELTESRMHSWSSFRPVVLVLE